MLQFSHNLVSFTFTQKGNPQSQVTLTNRSSFPIYYKFKVNRPKYYLVKPDRGLIHAHATVVVKIKLHREGFSQANADKFKCFWVQSESGVTDQDMNKFEQRLTTNKTKLLIKLNNLPPELDHSPNLVQSQLKSLGVANSNFNMNPRVSSTTYESIVRERQERVVELKNEIESIQKIVRDKKIAEGPIKNDKSIVPYIIVGIVGIVAGFVSSVWI